MSFALLFPSPQLPPTLSYILNRKHQISRDKDPSTSPWEGPVWCQALGLVFIWLCVLALTPTSTPSCSRARSVVPVALAGWGARW